MIACVACSGRTRSHAAVLTETAQTRWTCCSLLSRAIAEAHDVARANAPTPLSPGRAALVTTASRSLQREPSGARPHSSDPLPNGL
ncbi:MAG: hypothetical protein CBARDCOR_3401 [uncultured Caballeronia sp.]|nr:MAG: hypothetical protein CBARDCOR_3401 [uncultured Caballeronia sp.]